jgi:hypothetical protein
MNIAWWHRFSAPTSAPRRTTARLATHRHQGSPFAIAVWSPDQTSLSWQPGSSACLP